MGVSEPIPPFQRFLDTYRGEVWRLICASVPASEADDCFQETFIAALRAYPRLRRGSDLRAWVLTIAHRKALDAHRARARRALPVGDPAEHDTRESLAAHTRESAAAGARDEQLWEAVGSLPDRQRSAVVLRFLADLPHRDIATAIGCSEAAARRSLHEGLAKLREAAPA
jgi:RNA polymerase sigma factor (sigma-70 family)